MRHLLAYSASLDVLNAFGLDAYANVMARSPLRTKKKFPTGVRHCLALLAGPLPTIAEVPRVWPLERKRNAGSSGNGAALLHASDELVGGVQGGVHERDQESDGSVAATGPEGDDFHECDDVDEFDFKGANGDNESREAPGASPQGMDQRDRARGPPEDVLVALAAAYRLKRDDLTSK